MLKSILVPLDGSEQADQALHYVQDIVARKSVRTTLLRVLPDLIETDGKQLTALVAQAESHLHACAERLSGNKRSARCETRLGLPAEEILKFVTLARPSLVVMFTHGRRGLDRLAHGSVAEKVLRHGNCPLLLSNPASVEHLGDSSSFRLDRILVPLDGSRASADILPMVETLAKIFESEITLFHHDLGVSEFAESEPHVDSETLLEPHRKRLARKGLKVALMCSSLGSASKEILSKAEEIRADMVAMTTHGRSGVSRGLYGSVAEDVLRHASCPTLIVRGVP